MYVEHNIITDMCTKIRTDDIFMIYFVEDMYDVQNLVNGIPDSVSIYTCIGLFKEIKNTRI